MASLPDPAQTPQPTVLQRPKPVEPASLAGLLQYEADIRRQTSVPELAYFVANETRRIVPYEQMFILRRARVGQGFYVDTASSIATVDRNAPLIHALEKTLGALDTARAQDVMIDAKSSDPAFTDYPFTSFRWEPLFARDGTVFAGLLLARVADFEESEAIRLAHIGETVSHSWRALTGDRPVRQLPALTPWRKRLLFLALLVGALFPVRMTALAPVEVVPSRPFVVAAPYAGVIARIDVAPNALVALGQPVLTFEDIKVRNELQQAAQRVQVAKARIDRATSAAFGQVEEAREIGTMRAEYDVAIAQYNYARDLMAKSQIAAPVSGMALYSDRRDWEGRAVEAGEPILQIADPRAVAYRIDLPTREQMALEQGGQVKIWLDAQPLSALTGTIEQASYLSRPTAEGILAFAIIAKPDGSTPRIGSRGTAKLYGEWVPFAFSVLKRPFASLRQFFGI